MTKKELAKELKSMDKKLQEVIDSQNTITAQNIALTLALSSLLAELPQEFQETVRKRHELSLALLQNQTNNGKTDLSTLQIQREQFELACKRIFGN